MSAKLPKSTWIKRASTALMCLASGSAFAQGGGAPMPWEGPLQKITASISGPVAMSLGVIVIVIAGLGIAFGESGSGVRKLLQVVLGLGIAFTASSIIASLFGVGGAS